MSLVPDRPAVDLHGHTREPMRKISEYEHNAHTCLKLAAMISDPAHKTNSTAHGGHLDHAGAWAQETPVTRSTVE